MLAMPNTRPPLVDQPNLTLAADAARQKALCDYGIYLGAGEENVETAVTLAPQVCGLKFYLDATYGPLHLRDLAVIREHFARWPKDRPIACHAEERTLAAILMVAGLEDRTVHICHVSRRSEIELIRDAKMRGVKVTCEVTPHHLFLTQDDIPRLGVGRSEVRPVLATKADQAALWANLEMVDCIATDHAPHTLAEKDGENPPPGFPGLETSLALMLTAAHQERIDMDGIIARMYTNPARIFGLPLQPDTWIEVDVDEAWIVRGSELFSRCGWTPFEGWTLRGRVHQVTLHGAIVYHNGTFTVKQGTGQNIAPAFQKMES